MEETDAILGELSCEEVQEMVDKMLGDRSFSFTGYVEKLIQGQLPFSVENVAYNIVNGLAANVMQERKMYVYLILIGVIGAVLGNFTNLLQGKQVAETAFYAVYLLFFSVLLTAFSQTTHIAENTLTSLLDFMKVLSPAYFMSMAFSEGAMASGAYYEFTLVMITVVDWVLVKFALPAIHIYFLLRVANQFSEKDIFSKMAELIRDTVQFVMKTMFGLMMGFNVIQGMILPMTSKIETSAVVKLGGAIPGVGNAVSGVASTVLLAGNLVKNAVGVTGVIAVFFYCGVPLLRMVLHRFLFQLTGAVIQPVSDQRMVACISAVVEALQLMTYAVFVGCMMFVVSIALISTMTSL